MSGGRAKFADECADILRSVASRDSGAELDQIVADTGIPGVQVVDLIDNYLSRNIKVVRSRVHDMKVTRYVATPT